MSDQQSSTIHILLVEDGAINQRVFPRLLERGGYSVSLARNGQEAVTKLTSPSDDARIDLVLMDLDMPKMGGFEATGLIREHEKSTGKRVPIVALTSHGMPGDREKCLDAGMDDFIAKPITLEALNPIVQRLLPDSAKKA